MKQTEILLIILAAAGLLLWLLWRVGRLRDELRREREENLHLRELLQMGNQMAQTDLEQLRKLRHDLRQYLILTEDRSLPPDSASTLRNALEELPAESGRESWAMSVLEQYYLDQANALGFQTDLHITPPLDWEGAIPDLCLVLSNLLENSLEALQREGGGWLRARSVSAAGYFSLVIGNSCTRPLRTFNGRYLSSKAPGRFGIGLDTVQEVAQRYGGQAEFTVEDGAFRASVFLLRPARSLSARNAPAKAAPLTTLHS